MTKWPRGLLSRQGDLPPCAPVQHRKTLTLLSVCNKVSALQGDTDEHCALSGRFQATLLHRHGGFHEPDGSCGFLAFLLQSGISRNSESSDGDSCARSYFR